MESGINVDEEISTSLSLAPPAVPLSTSALLTPSHSLLDFSLDHSQTFSPLREFTTSTLIKAGGLDATLPTNNDTKLGLVINLNGVGATDSSSIVNDDTTKTTDKIDDGNSAVAKTSEINHKNVANSKTEIMTTPDTKTFKMLKVHIKKLDNAEIQKFVSKKLPENKNRIKRLHKSICYKEPSLVCKMRRDRNNRVYIKTNTPKSV